MQIQPYIRQYIARSTHVHRRSPSERLIHKKEQGSAQHSTQHSPSGFIYPNLKSITNVSCIIICLQCLIISGGLYITIISTASIIALLCMHEHHIIHSMQHALYIVIEPIICTQLCYIPLSIRILHGNDILRWHSLRLHCLLPPPRGSGCRGRQARSMDSKVTQTKHHTVTRMDPSN